MPVSYIGRPFKLYIYSPGVIDLLYFERDKLFITELKADEVKIDVKAIALK